jgi:hypothetical protein
MSTWLPKAHEIQETDLKSLENMGFEWIEADESFKKRKNDCILLGFYIHPISGTPFAAIVVKDPDSMVGKKYLYHCEARQSADESLLVTASI